MSAIDDFGDSFDMIVVMGVTGAGKSHFINTLSGTTVVEEGSLLSTQRCQLVPIETGGTRIGLLDTPGFDDSGRPDSEILENIARVLTAQHELGWKLRGVIYLHRITDERYSGSAVKTFEIFKKVCGQGALGNIFLVTSRWSGVDQVKGSDRERELKDKFWAGMLAEGSGMSRFHGDKQSAIALVSQLLYKDPVVLDLQHELLQPGKKLEDTAAGVYVSNDLDKVKARYEKDLADLRDQNQRLSNNEISSRQTVQDDMEARHRDFHVAQRFILQKVVGDQVRGEIQARIPGLTKFLPLIRASYSLLSYFVEVPPKLRQLLESWVADTREH